ncbi:unnamed protein product [Durusdinium trenchii]
MAEENCEMRGKAIRVNLGVEGQSVRDHTAGSGVASEETTPVPAAESEAYSDGDWHESEASVTSEPEDGPDVATPSQGSERYTEESVGTASEVDVVGDHIEPVASNTPDNDAVSEADVETPAEVPAEAEVQIDVNVASALAAHAVEVEESADELPDIEESSEQPREDQEQGTNAMESPIEVEPEDPQTPAEDEDERVPGEAEDEDAPQEDPVAEVDPEDPVTEEGYTSMEHSYHASDEGADSEASDDPMDEEQEASQEALKGELAEKEEEHDKLASQLRQMQLEMETLRKMLEQNQQELANSSQELEKARAELNDLRKQQNESAAASQAEREAFRQVEKLMKDKKSLREQLEKMQEQMVRMESLQQQLEKRLIATERERDAVKQRLQMDSWKPHRIEEAEAARRRTGGEFRVLEKPVDRMRRPRHGAQQRDVWRFQPRQRGALVLRMRPGLDSPRSNQKLYPGDSFVVSEQRKGPSDLVFLKLADGRGWAFNRSPDVGTLCVPRPARKDRLAPYRLPEGARLPGKIRQDQALRARPRLPAIPKPVRDSRAPWH